MNASTPLVGVVDLPALASVLTQAGYTVITGDAPRAAAAAIRENLNAHGPFPVIIFDSPWAGHRAWSDKISQETTTVVVRGEFGQPNTKFTGPILIDLPAPLYEIAAAAGLPLSPEASEMTMLTNGHISGQPQPQPVVPADSPVAQTPPLAPATYEAATAPTPEPAPVVYDESTMTAPTVMQPESAPAPAFSPGLDGPWSEQGVPAPEQPVHTAPAAFAPEPTPSFTAPVAPSFPDAPAPVFEQPVAPAFPEPPAPAFEAPAAPVYQPVAEAPAFEAPAPVAPAFPEPPAPAFEPPVAPVAPAFPEPPAPAFEAPAVPVYQPVAEAPAFEAPVAPVAPGVYQPVAEAPAFEAPVAPVAPAFPEPPAPAFEAPAAPVYQPVADAPAFPEPPAFEAPAAPVYQPVAPVAYEAPAAPVYQPVAPVAYEAPAFEPPAPVAPVAPAYQSVAEAPAFEAPLPAAPVYQQPAPVAYEAPVAPVAPVPPAPVMPQAPAFETAPVAPPQALTQNLPPVSHFPAVDIPPVTGDGLAEVVVVYAGKGGVGKAVTLDTAIPTPTGWTTMGDLAVGDTVIGRDGRATSVTAVFDHEALDLYDIHLSDGQVIRACADHNWVVAGYYDRLNAEHPKRIAAGARWDESRAFADRLIALADSFGEDDLLSLTAIFNVVREVDGCVWTSKTPLKIALRGIGLNEAAVTSRATHKIRVFDSRAFLDGLVTTWSISLTNHSLRGNWTRNRAMLAAAQSLLAQDNLPAKMPVKDIRARLQEACAEPVIDTYSLSRSAAKFTRVTSRMVAVEREVARTMRQDYPARLALKTLAAHVVSQIPPLRPSTAVRERVMTTAQMIAEGVKVFPGGKANTNFAIALTAPAQFPHVELPIAPYVLGAWLGDGTTDNGTITSNPTGIDFEEADQIHLLRQFEAEGYQAAPTASTPMRVAVTGLNSSLRALGVRGSKHIPTAYLRASFDQRLALLQGLMDTDGTVDENGSSELSLSDRRLASDALELIRSLGIKASVSWDQPASYRDKGTGEVVACKNRHRIHFTSTATVFRLPRKAARLRDSVRKTQDWLYITDITPAPSAPGRCITVDSSDHTFLVAGFVPTHNTTTSVGLAHSASARGLRVILIDGNRGQGDIRKFLRLDMAALPSVLNFAATNSLRDTLIDPTRLNEARVGQDPLRFAVVTAAPSEAADDSVVTPEVYLRLVQECRKVCDLVVIDTQIIEPKKTVDEMVARFVNPLVRAGAWSIGVADLSNPGISNLLTRLKRVASMNVPRERTLTMLNRVPSDLEFNRDGIAQAFGEHSLYMGIVYSESGITEVMNLGGVPGSHPAIGDLLNSAVSYFRPEWAQLAATQVDQAPEPVASGKKSRFGLRRK